MGLFPSHPIRVEPYLGYRSGSRLVLSARAVRAPAARFAPAGRLRVFRDLLSQFTTHEAAGVAVSLEIPAPDGRLLHYEATTDAEGFVHFDIALDPAFPVPEHASWETMRLGWDNCQGRQGADAYVMVPGTDSRIAVISDIDDTIIETGITGGLRSLLRNWRRLLAELPDDRLAVPGAGPFYAVLGGGGVPSVVAQLPASAPVSASASAAAMPATRRAFFYVSSSPWNLFAYLLAFKRAKGLPFGPLLLRDWGLNRATFGSSSHGAHKRAAIRDIFAMFPALHFALIGDDTQGDLPAYAEIAGHHPDRVAAIFIRTTRETGLSPAAALARDAIEAAGVPLWLGEGYGVAQDFLDAAGMTPGGDTAQIIRTVEQAAG